MKKGKAITLLSIICVIMAFVVVMTFVNFPVGVKNFNGVLGAIETDYDVSGGTAYTLTLANDNINNVYVDDEHDNINQVLTTIGKRLDALGYQTYSVKAIKDTDDAVKDYDIRIETRAPLNEYGKENIDALNADIAVVAAYGKVKFFGGTSENPTEEILSGMKVVSNAKYTGVASNGGTAYYTIAVEFTDEGYKALSKLTSENDSYYVQIKLGDNVLYNSALHLDSKTLNLSTTAGEKNAQQFALQIASGGLDYKYDVSDGVSVSSPYGQNAKTICSIVVGGILLVAIVLFFIVYCGYGFISGLTLVLFMILELLMFIAVPGIKINMGGILGIIFATLLVVDGLVIIRKRISEEYANGKMVKTAVKTGLARSLKPILGINAVGAIVAIMLYALCTGALKGFAITFGIGVVISAISTLVFARMFFALVCPINKYSDKFLKLKREEE